MRTYLRFTRQEFRAISRACRSLPLTDDCFATFRSSLVAALAASQPDLARRIDSFRLDQVRILFHYLRGWAATSPGE